MQVLTPAGNANAGRFQLTRGVFSSYAPQLTALFHARDPEFDYLQAALADLTSANPLFQSNVSTLVHLLSHVSARRF